MTKYRVSGKYSLKGFSHDFSKKISAENEENAKELTYCYLGSNHKLKRGQIMIESIEVRKGKQAEQKVEKKEVIPAKVEAPKPEATEDKASEAPEQ